MLEIKNVKVEYYSTELATLNFVFDRGVTLILGEVGSFKTTLFSVIGGIKEIPDGEIILDGKNIEELPPKDRNMAYVGENSMPRGGKVHKSLMLPLRLRGVSKKESTQLVQNAAKLYGLDPTKKLRHLTEIERIKFFSARLSLRKSNITMFDEPYHYFGHSNEQSITDMIKSRTGYVLVSSCDGSDVKRLCPDYLVVVRRNEVLQCGKTDEVLSNPISEYVDKFLNL